MNTHFFIKKTVAGAALLSLVVLLLLSPCKIRNSVQSALNLPQTEVSNKSACQVYEELESILLTEKYVQQKLVAQTAPHTPVINTPIAFSPSPLSAKEEGLVTVTPIPYYILYQNLKLHL